MKLSPSERRRYALLAVPTLGLSLGATTLASYLPVLAQPLTSSRAVIGGVVGGEGLVALLLPVWIGAASDRARTRLGRRLPFLLATAPIAAGALIAMPFGRSVAALAGAALVFYVAYFTYYAPYRALYADVVPREHAGRAQGLQGAFRAAGMGAALIAGALLMPVGRTLPFVTAAVVLLGTAFFTALALPPGTDGAAAAEPSCSPHRLVWSLIRERPDLRRFLGANVLWQLMEGGLKTFIVLYIHEGLRRSFSFSAGAMAVVALSALVSAPLAGKLADRFGAARVMRVLLWVFGLGVLLPAFSTSMTLLLVELPLMGVGGAMALALPYALLMKLVPHQSHGATAGLFDVASGAGTLLGPLATGAAIDLLRPLFPATSGYAAMWLVIGGASLASTLLLRDKVASPGDAG